MAGTRLKLVTTPSQFAATVKFLVAPKVDNILKKAKPAIQNRISNLLRTAIEGSPTIQSLKGGQLQADFGLTDGAASAATIDIVNAVVSAVNVFFQRSRQGKTLGNLVIQIDPAIISGLVQASTTNGIYNSNGNQITWLDWLMNKGTQVIIDGFEVVPTTDYNDRSRSGGGFMLPTGGVFRVDPEFAGTPGDNFITRAIIANGPNIRKIIQEEFKRLF
jgi:outer membrane receptor protein involved in Fe transport